MARAQQRVYIWARKRLLSRNKERCRSRYVEWVRPAIEEYAGRADTIFTDQGRCYPPHHCDHKIAQTFQCFGLNRMDLMQREGKYPLPPLASKTILGVEFSGTVSKLGDGAKTFKEGDEVFGLAYGVSVFPLSLIQLT